MTAHIQPLQKVNFAKEGERPENVNGVTVTVNVHPQMAGAPIQLGAGCSWASLDVDTTRELIRVLYAAITALDEDVHD